MRTSNHPSPVAAHDLESGFVIVARGKDSPYWAAWTRAWSQIRPAADTLDGYRFISYLGDLHQRWPQAQTPQALWSSKHWIEATRALRNAKSIPLVVHPRTWGQIDQAREAMNSPTLLKAVHTLGWQARQAFETLKGGLIGLIKPSSHAAAIRVDLASGGPTVPGHARSTPACARAAPGPIPSVPGKVPSLSNDRRAPPEPDPLIDDQVAFRDDLKRYAQEIRKRGCWYGVGGEIAITTLVHLPGWPPGRPLQIEAMDGQVRARFGDAGWTGEPVRVRFNAHRQHYDALVDGQPVVVPADGDCFFASVLRGMSEAERRTLLSSRAPTVGASKNSQQALRSLVARRVEQMADAPASAPESVVNTWIAFRT